MSSKGGGGRGRGRKTKERGGIKTPGFPRCWSEWRSRVRCQGQSTHRHDSSTEFRAADIPSFRIKF